MPFYKWTAITRVKQVNTTLTIPALSFTGVPLIAASISSIIITEFSGDAGESFTFHFPAVAASDHVLAVRDSSGARYKLWEGVGEVLHYPLYEGQTLLEDFVVEVWSANSATIESEAGVITTGILTDPSASSCCCPTNLTPDTITMTENPVLFDPFPYLVDVDWTLEFSEV